MTCNQHAKTESSRQHSHGHSHNHDAENQSTQLSHRFKSPHPHRTADPATRLARLLLFLEAQFGEDAVSPIAYPRNSTASAPDTQDANTDGDVEFSPEDKQELKRLHNLGIPVPGIEIKFDRFVAKVWLEDLEVECENKPLRARVKAVVERAVETVSGLWS